MSKSGNEYRDPRGFRHDGKARSERYGQSGGASTGWCPREDEGIIEEYVITITPDRPAPTITLQGFSLLVLAFLLFKAGVIAWLGPEAHAGAIALLEAGSPAEQAAAFLMRADFFSQFLAESLFLRLG
ncbi:MAG: hypothetical protein RIG84_03765 [Roseovarius sp.]